MPTSDIFYTQGLVSTYNGSPADPRRVVGNGTLWAGGGGVPIVQPGDTLLVEGRLPYVIEEVTDDDDLLVATDIVDGPWDDEPYLILFTSPRRTTSVALAQAIVALQNKLRVFDAAAPVISIKSFAEPTPPIDLAVGERVVVGLSPSGDFTGHANEIAEKTSTGYIFTAPEHGWHTIDREQNMVRAWDGDSWSTAIGLGAQITFAGAWNNSTDYVIGNVVTYQDRAWVAIQDNTNEAPGADSVSSWESFVLMGEDGGAITLRFEFDTETTIADPGSGRLRLNNSAFASVSTIAVSKTDFFGTDVGSVLLALDDVVTSTKKGKLRIKQKGSDTQWCLFDLTSVSDQSSYVTIAVESGTGGILPDDAGEVLFFFSERGEVGATGATGETGLRGQAGGGIAINLVVDALTTQDSDPGNGKIRFGSVPQRDSTVIRVDDVSSGGSPISTLLDSINDASTSAIKAHGRLTLAESEETYLAFDISEVIAMSGYRNLVVHVTGYSAADPFDDQDEVVLFWSAKGDKGDTGEVGATGPAGQAIQPDYTVEEITSTASPPQDDRDAHDNDPAGTIVLVASLGNIYVKLSNASGDWSSPISVRQVSTGQIGLVSVRVVAVANVDISADLAEGETVDGVTLVAGDAVLLANQSTASQNGIYTVPVSGAAARHADYDQFDDIVGRYFYVVEGTSWAKSLWRCTSLAGGTIDISNIEIKRADAGRSTPSIASATSLDLTNYAGDVVNITGNTTISSVTLPDGASVLARFSGTPQLTHGSSLVVSGGASRTMVAGWQCLFRGSASGVVYALVLTGGRHVDVDVDLSSVYSASEKAQGQKNIGLMKGADIASASSLNLDAATGDIIDITGTTTVTAVTLAQGRRVVARAVSGFSITASSNLIVNGSSSGTWSVDAGTHVWFYGRTGTIVEVLIQATRCVVDAYDTAGSYTWTKRPGARAVTAIVVGGGGGGGSGRRGATSTNRFGGTGGGGGAVHVETLPAEWLGSTEAVTVGAGGPGGAAVTTNDTNGNSGTAGGMSSFGSWVKAGGGGRGFGGTTTTSTGRSGGGGGGWTGDGSGGAASDAPGGAPYTLVGTYGGYGWLGSTGSSSDWGGGGGGGIESSLTAFAGGDSANGSGGGGAGGSINSSNAIQAAAAGGGHRESTVTGYGGGGAAGGTGAAGTAGASRSTHKRGYGAEGGGGGGASSTAAAGAGGVGGVPGGGGASLNGFNSGAGGDGGRGEVVVITWF